MAHASVALRAAPGGARPLHTLLRQSLSLGMGGMGMGATSGSSSAVGGLLARSRMPLAGGQLSSPTAQLTRGMNRNARRPKKANHGKRPCSRIRRRARAAMIKSRAHRKKIFGSY